MRFSGVLWRQHRLSAGPTDISSPPELYTPQEIELIRQYRMLDERGRRSVEGALRFEQEWSYRQKK